MCVKEWLYVVGVYSGLAVKGSFLPGTYCPGLHPGTAQKEQSQLLKLSMPCFSVALYLPYTYQLQTRIGTLPLVTGKAPALFESAEKPSLHTLFSHKRSQGALSLHTNTQLYISLRPRDGIYQTAES